MRSKLIACAWTLSCAVALGGLFSMSCAQSGGEPPPTPAAAVAEFPASQAMTDAYGIVEWKVFIGPHEISVTGFKADGSPAARGVQESWFLSDGASPAHVRILMLDGTGAEISAVIGGQTTGSLSPSQIALAEATESDWDRALEGGTVVEQGPPPGLGGGIRPLTVDSVRVGTGLHALLDSQNTGPQCQQELGMSSWKGAGYWSKILGCAVAPESIGACYKAIVGVYDAMKVCNAENATHCKYSGATFGPDDGFYYNCDWNKPCSGMMCKQVACGGGGTGTMFASLGTTDVTNGGCPTPSMMEGGTPDSSSDGGGGNDGGGADDGGTCDDGGGYAMIMPAPRDHHHPFRLESGASTSISFSWTNAAGVEPPADLWVESNGPPLLQVVSVDAHPFARVGLDVVPLTSNVQYRLVLEGDGKSVHVMLLDGAGEEGNVVIEVKTKPLVRSLAPEAPVVDVVLPGPQWRKSIVSNALSQ